MKPNEGYDLANGEAEDEWKMSYRGKTELLG